MGFWRKLFGGGKEDYPGEFPEDPTGATDPKRRRNVSPLQELAVLLGVPQRRLAFVLWHDPEPYRQITIPKRDGRTRTLHAPSSARKFVQRKIHERILRPCDTSPVAHGFRRGRSIFTGAHFHTNQSLVVRIDLEDFFPTITSARVGGVFRSLELHGGIVRLLTQLCTHEGRLPQGAPTSPVLANLVCRKLDRRIFNLARKEGFHFTRYADDITISGSMRIKKFIPLVRTIVRDEGFVVAEKKTRLMNYGRRQEVTGLVVNRRVSVPRDHRRWIRAIVHNAGKTGLDAQNHTGYPRFREFLLGHACHIGQTHPNEGKRLKRQIRRVRA